MSPFRKTVGFSSFYLYYTILLYYGTTIIPTAFEFEKLKIENEFEKTKKVLESSFEFYVEQALPTLIPERLRIVKGKNTTKQQSQRVERTSWKVYWPHWGSYSTRFCTHRCWPLHGNLRVSIDDTGSTRIRVKTHIDGYPCRRQGQICLAFTIGRFNVAPKTQPLVAAITEVRSVPLELDLLHLDKIECLFVRYS